MTRVSMRFDRRLCQLLAGTVVCIFYVQFQLLSYTDRRLFLKKLQLALPQVASSSSNSDSKTVCTISSAEVLHGLVLFTWQSKHITDLNSLKEYPLFPKHPSSVQFGVKSSLRLSNSVSTGGWLFGLLQVPVSGVYSFQLSISGEAELLLNRNSEPEGTPVVVRQLRAGENEEVSRQRSTSFHLKKCESYYLEIIFYIRGNNGFVELAWETPFSLSYQIIPMKYLLPYITSQDFAEASEKLLIFQDSFTINSLFTHLSQKKHSIEDENLDQWRRLPYMLSAHARNLRKCSRNFTGVARNHGLPKVHSRGIDKFVGQYFRKLVHGSNGKYALLGVNAAEERILGTDGTRYLMNVEFQDNIMEARVRVSEYIFYDNVVRDLCVMDDFIWKRDAMVTVVTVISRIDIWSQYFLDHLSAMTNKLQDSRFDVIIVSSKELKQYFQAIITQNSLAWHSQVTLLLINANKLQNTASILKAVLARISTPDTILFLTDVRVQYPLRVLEYIRKHTIEGKTAYVPWPENFHRRFSDNDTISCPLDWKKPDRAPSLAIFFPDLVKITGYKLASKRHDAGELWEKNWWEKLTNGALELYASRMPKFYYFEPE